MNRINKKENVKQDPNLAKFEDSFDNYGIKFDRAQKRKLPKDNDDFFNDFYTARSLKR